MWGGGSEYSVTLVQKPGVQFELKLCLLPHLMLTNTGILRSYIVAAIVVTMVAYLKRHWLVDSIELLLVTFVTGCHKAKQKGKLGNKN